LKIETGRLVIQDGAQASVSTGRAGDAGRLTVRASEVELTGTSKDGYFPSTLQARVEQGSQGNGGDLTIETGQLIVRDRAQVTVSNQGTGNAGNLDVAARSIRLENQGAILAETASAQGGNITLQVQDLLLMRNNSLVSTTAGTAGAGGNGGNIDIDADLLVAVPTENSDIAANAFEGSGGNINIATQGIFGLEFREQQAPDTSDITASSDFGVDGTVEINTPDVDPSQGLVSLPVVPVDTEVAQTCTPGGSQDQSEFLVTGRGGLPPNPGETLNTDAVQVDLVTLKPEVAQPTTTAVSTSPANSTPTPIVEATGWAITANGEVILTANAPRVTPHSSWQKTANCQQLEG
jgi:large exoprotein involved in heme utilization and adhesion